MWLLECGFVDLQQIMEITSQSVNSHPCMRACSYVPIFEPGSQREVTEEDLRQRRSKSTSMMRQMDADGDGMISRDEFQAILTDSADMDALANYDMRLMPEANDKLVAQLS